MKSKGAAKLTKKSKASLIKIHLACVPKKAKVRRGARCLICNRPLVKAGFYCVQCNLTKRGKKTEGPPVHRIDLPRHLIPQEE
jgi:hypothetical protein